MRDMYTMNATDVRREWSTVIDTTTRDKPVFIRRTRDEMMLSDTRLIRALLSPYSIEADYYAEEDGSITLSSRSMDIVSNGESLQAAKAALACDLMEYAEDYYQHFAEWSAAPNRREHVPYVLKILVMDSLEELEESIQCHDGKN